MTSFSDKCPDTNLVSEVRGWGLIPCPVNAGLTVACHHHGYSAEMCPVNSLHTYST